MDILYIVLYSSHWEYLDLRNKQVQGAIFFTFVVRKKILFFKSVE